MNPSNEPKTPAEMYETFFVPAIFEPLSKLVLSAAHLRTGSAVLDVACGTGIVARGAATAVGNSGRVAALDLRPGMLATARGIAREGAAIEWHEGDAQALPFADGTFDAVLCQQGLQFFADREKALREMKRVSKPGARVALACWRELELQEFFKELGDVELAHLRYVGMKDEDMLVPFSLADRNEIVRLCAAADFGSVEIREAELEANFPSENFVYNMEFGYAAVMPHFAENPAAFAAYVETVTKETEELRTRHTRNGRLSFPLHAHIVSARA